MNMSINAILDERCSGSPEVLAVERPFVMSQEIGVRDLRLSARIGAHSHEVGRRQALVIDVTVMVKVVQDDSLAETLDYNAIVTHAEALADEHIALIETFSRRLAQSCLDDPRTLSAVVTVHKPSALSNGVASARTSISRSAST